MGRFCDIDKQWPGSVGPAPIPKFSVTHRGQELLENPHVCPVPLISPLSYKLLSLYKHYDKQLLPFSGGVLDQPNIYIEAMEIIGDTLAEIAREKAKRG